MNHYLVCQVRGPQHTVSGEHVKSSFGHGPRIPASLLTVYLLLPQAKCEEQAARISAVDLENLQLIDRLHALSTEFGQMQSVIKEQREKNDDLQR
jgi:hypothetical protein